MKRGMKEKEHDIALYHQRKRRKHKIKLALISFFTLLIGLSFVYAYFKFSQDEYNRYTEKAKVDYIVNLKENEFYPEDHIDERTSVVASLIKDIEADFKYSLNLDASQEYSYSYKIIAKTNVKETSRANSIYETSEELLSKELQQSNSKKLEISEKIKIDYNQFNEKINKFISVYNLTNTTNTLQLDMYVYVTNQYDGQQVNKQSKVMTLNIPLTTKTVDITLTSNVIEDQGLILSKKSEYDNINWILAVGGIFVLVSLIVFIVLIKYILDNRRAETMYKQELKKILFNYKNYIQTVNNEIDEKPYKKIQINTFNEMLGMRETIQAPILMYTEEGELRTKFTIINEGLLYIYVLGAQEIREELRAKSAKKKKEQENNTKEELENENQPEKKIKDETKKKDKK